jgi:hypothetical protein
MYGYKRRYQTASGYRKKKTVPEIMNRAIKHSLLMGIGQVDRGICAGDGVPGNPVNRDSHFSI